jgi:hypothetical protein
LSGCDDFFEVRNPNVIDAETVDAVQDGDIFARSAFQTLSQAYGVMIVYSGWFSNEAWVGDTFPTRNEYGRRTVASTNGTHTNDVWFPLARSVLRGSRCWRSAEWGTRTGAEPGSRGADLRVRSCAHG